MGSSKGKPTDPKLREQAKEDVKASDKGGAPGQWTANKASQMAQEYEKRGGDYEDKEGSKNEAKKGKPEPKDADAKKEAKKPNQNAAEKAAKVKKTQETKKKAAPKNKANAKEDDDEEEEQAEQQDGSNSKAKGGKKAAAPKQGKASGGKKAGQDSKVISEFQKYVNMDEKELKDWLGSKKSEEVGWKPDGGESTGHKSGKYIVELLQKGEEDLTADDLSHMKHVNAYCKRHLKQKPKDPENSKWRWSLMNWGHDPMKSSSEAQQDMEEDE